MFYRHHKRVHPVISGPSRTRQEFAKDCDINQIMARYQKTGVISHVAPRAPQYLDVGAVPDMMTAMNAFIAAEAAFMSLPSQVRKEFDNDPMRFVMFTEDAENLPKLREWGLARPEPVAQAPMRVEVVNPAPAPEGAS